MSLAHLRRLFELLTKSREAIRDAERPKSPMPYKGNRWALAEMQRKPHCARNPRLSEPQKRSLPAVYRSYLAANGHATADDSTKIGLSGRR